MYSHSSSFRSNLLMYKYITSSFNSNWIHNSWWKIISSLTLLKYIHYLLAPIMATKNQFKLCFLVRTMPFHSEYFTYKLMFANNSVIFKLISTWKSPSVHCHLETSIKSITPYAVFIVLFSILFPQLSPNAPNNSHIIQIQFNFQANIVA